MEYQVLARKWRPQSFDDLVGQEHIAQTLKNSILQGRIAHAYLFTGIRGVGKTSAARILAKALNCEDGPKVDPDPNSPICKEIDRGSFLDVIEIDGASNTGVDDVRDLKESIQYLPSKGRYKVYIIDEVHMLSKAAFNALLKTLEEPPANVVFIFATTEVQRLPETILSRCQRFDFRRVGRDAMAGRLREIAKQEGISVGEETLATLAGEGQGSMRDALTLMDRVISYCGETIEDQMAREVLGLVDRKTLLGLSVHVVAGESKAAILELHRIYQLGFDLKRFLQSFLELVRSASLIKMGIVDANMGLSKEQVQEVQEIFGAVATPTLDRYFDLIKRTLFELSRTDQEIFLAEQLLIRLSTTSAEFASVDQVLEWLRESGNASASTPAHKAKSANMASAANSIDDPMVKKAVGLFDAKVERVQTKD